MLRTHRHYQSLFLILIASVSLCNASVQAQSPLSVSEDGLLEAILEGPIDSPNHTDSSSDLPTSELISEPLPEVDVDNDDVSARITRLMIYPSNEVFACLGGATSCGGWDLSPSTRRYVGRATLRPQYAPINPVSTRTGPFLSEESACRSYVKERFIDPYVATFKDQVISEASGACLNAEARFFTTNSCGAPDCHGSNCAAATAQPECDRTLANGLSWGGNGPDEIRNEACAGKATTCGSEVVYRPPQYTTWVTYRTGSDGKKRAECNVTITSLGSADTTGASCVACAANCQELAGW